MPEIIPESEDTLVACIGIDEGDDVIEAGNSGLLLPLPRIAVSLDEVPQFGRTFLIMAFWLT